MYEDFNLIGRLIGYSKDVRISSTSKDYKLISRKGQSDIVVVREAENDFGTFKHIVLS